MLSAPPTVVGHRRSLVARQRFLLAGSLLLAVALPFALRYLIPGAGYDPGPSQASLVANFISVVVGFWIRYSIATFPGTRMGLTYLPSIATAHAAVAAAILFLRIPYDRAMLLAGFLLDLGWCMAVYLAVHRRIRQTIAVVPVGDVDALETIDWIDWKRLDAPDLARAGKVDAIVADFDADLPDAWEAFLADAALDGRNVFQQRQLMESLTGKVRVSHLSENSFGSLVPARAYFHIKTLADWIAAWLLSPLIVPVLAAIAIAIRLDGPGPVLFRQQRIGQGGRPFTMLKFRTMVPAAPDAADRAAAITGPDDPRITRIGRYLRRTRLDELPQWWNILRGEMSWIGPRPEAGALADWYTGEIPFYRYRHVVKPGISGWAQVNQGHVADVEAVGDKLRYDFFYIKYFSLWLDLLIVLRTIRTMATGFGAR